MASTEHSAGPKYQSIKQVRALRITAVDGYTVSFDPADNVRPLTLEPVMFARYIPAPGDYLVTYEDGYRSFSPGDVFEAGYIRLEAEHGHPG